MLRGDLEINHIDILEASDEPIFFNSFDFFDREIEPKLRKLTITKVIKQQMKEIRLEFLDCSNDVFNELIDMLTRKIEDDVPFEAFELSQPNALSQVKPDTLQNLANKIISTLNNLNLSYLSESS